MTSKITATKVTRTQSMTTSAGLNMGICVTCNSAPSCVNLKATHQPIWYCDQFDDYVPPSAATEKPRLLAKAPIVQLSTNGSLEGLCRTCGNKNDCVNQTPGISKLFCEEHC